MKKVQAVIYMILTFFIIYFLQSNFFTWFNIAGIMPNLYIILILFIGLFIGKKLGLIFGIILGIYLDVIARKAIGISSITLGLIGFLAELLSKDFSKDSRLTIILIVTTATILYESATYIFGNIINSLSFEFGFLKILIIEVIFNSIITIIIYPLMKKVGYYFEDSFREKKVLTRFF